MGADTTVPGLDHWHAGHGVFAAWQPERPSNSDAGGANHHVLSLYIFICALWEKDTQEMLLVFNIMNTYHKHIHQDF